jgi:hypothetical protein
MRATTRTLIFGVANIGLQMPVGWKFAMRRIEFVFSNTPVPSNQKATHVLQPSNL